MMNEYATPQMDVLRFESCVITDSADNDGTSGLPTIGGGDGDYTGDH